MSKYVVVGNTARENKFAAEPAGWTSFLPHARLFESKKDAFSFAQEVGAIKDIVEVVEAVTFHITEIVEHATFLVLVDATTVHGYYKSEFERTAQLQNAYRFKTFTAANAALRLVERQSLLSRWEVMGVYDGVPIRTLGRSVLEEDQGSAE